MPLFREIVPLITFYDVIGRKYMTKRLMSTEMDILGVGRKLMSEALLRINLI